MGLVHAIADCLDCDWKASSLNSRVLAAQHHRKTGHQVMVEQCFSKTYLRTIPNPDFKHNFSLMTPKSTEEGGEA